MPNRNGYIYNEKKKIINSLRNIIEYMILIGTYFDKTYMEEE